MYSVGADIGGSHISVCLFDHSQKRLKSETLVVKKINRLGPAEEILSGWSEALIEAIAKSDGELAGIGIAMPGPFDYYHGVSLIKGVDKYESLFGMNIRQELAARTGINTRDIRFINDASAFTIAESFLGRAASYRKCTGITLGTGCGSAFTDQGQPVIRRDDAPSGGVLYDKLFRGSKADDLFSSRGLANLYFQLTGKTCESVHQLSEMSKSDDDARNTFVTFGENLGGFLNPWLKKFGTECLVLGGNICKAYPLFETSLGAQLNDIDIYVSTYGEEAAMIGAARLMEPAYYAAIKEVLRDM